MPVKLELVIANNAPQEDLLGSLSNVIRNHGQVFSTNTHAKESLLGELSGPAPNGKLDCNDQFWLIGA